MTNLEKQHRFQDRAIMIDEKLDKARSEINWERRKEAEKDIVSWVTTYVCNGLLLDDPPAPKGEEILHEMWRAIFDARPYMIEQARGSGKTSFIESVVLAAIAQGKRDFFVVIGQNVVASQNILADLFRVVSEEGTAFSQDYPDICLPFQLCHGSFRRRQTYNGVSTDIQRNVTKICFARLKNRDGNEAPTSSSCIFARGITSGLRGLKNGTKRPSCVILDDIQTDEVAESPEQVDKLMSVINKSVLNLGGKGKIACLQSATPIACDDLVERIEKDKAWKTTKYPAIIKFPKDILEHPNDGYWKKYFDIYDEENAKDATHEKSLKFYIRHRTRMDKGAEVLNPNRFKESDGHISALQALLDKKHQIGDAPFFCEFQMLPKRVDLVLNITQKDILKNINPSIQKNTVPDGFVFTCGALDLNTSYAGTYTLMCFKPDSTCCVIRHKINKLVIDQQLPDVQYDQALYNELCVIMKRVASLGLNINAFGIDCNGRNFKGTCEFCKNSMNLFGMPCCAMIGKASTNFNPLVRSRLRNAVGRVVLCGDEREHLKSGSGNKWLAFDSDFFRERVQRSFLTQLGNVGGCSLYNDLDMEHIEFAKQICNERIRWKKTKADGRVEYSWKSKEPHDYLDTCAMCHAIATHEGLSPVLRTTSNVITTGKTLRTIRHSRTRLKFV